MNTNLMRYILLRTFLMMIMVPNCFVFSMRSCLSLSHASASRRLAHGIELYPYHSALSLVSNRLYSSSSSSSNNEAETSILPVDTAKLDTISTRIGMNKIQRHIFLCADQGKPKCCSYSEGMESWDFLKARMRELKLVGFNADAARTKANCLQICSQGKLT